MLRFGLHKLVHDFLGVQIPSLVMQLPTPVHDFLRAAHHFDIERGGVSR